MSHVIYCLTGRSFTVYIHEHHVAQFRAYMKEMCTMDYEPENGKFKVSEAIGIGAEFSEFALTHCDD